MSTTAPETTIFNPFEFLRAWGTIVPDVPHVVFDPSVDDAHDFTIVCTMSHDGAMSGTLDLVTGMMNKFYQMSCAHKSMEGTDWSQYQGINYRVGNAKIESVGGMVDLPVGRYPGVTETVTLFVRAEYVKKEESAPCPPTPEIYGPPAPGEAR